MRGANVSEARTRIEFEGCMCQKTLPETAFDPEHLAACRVHYNLFRAVCNECAPMDYRL